MFFGQHLATNVFMRDSCAHCQYAGCFTSPVFARRAWLAGSYTLGSHLAQGIPGPQGAPRNPQHSNKFLGGGFKYFHPDPWGNDPIWRAYFSDGSFNHQLYSFLDCVGVSFLQWEVYTLAWTSMACTECVHSTGKSDGFFWTEEYVNADWMYTYVSKSINKYKIVKCKMLAGFAGCGSTCTNKIVVPANWV